MKYILSLWLAVFICVAVTPATQAEEIVIDGYASVKAGSSVIPGIEPNGLMIDPAVVKKRHEQIKRARVTRRQINPSRQIAVVPFDYKDHYNVGAFDSRRGEMDCSMKKAYAHCVYNKNY